MQRCSLKTSNNLIEEYISCTIKKIEHTKEKMEKYRSKTPWTFLKWIFQHDHQLSPKSKVHHLISFSLCLLSIFHSSSFQNQLLTWLLNTWIVSCFWASLRLNHKVRICVWLFHAYVCEIYLCCFVLQFLFFISLCYSICCITFYHMEKNNIFIHPIIDDYFFHLFGYYEQCYY